MAKRSNRSRDEEHDGDRRPDYAGYGPTDGIQSDASATEPKEFLDYLAGDNGDFNVRSGHSKKTRYSGDFNKA